MSDPTEQRASQSPVPSTALPPGSTIGILGGGQLGRMLAVAAAQLGFHTHIYSNVPGSAFEVADRHTVAEYEDEAAIEAFAQSVDVVTYEFENIPGPTARAAMKHAPLHPSLKALETSQDRIIEKAFLAAQGIPVAPYAVVTRESKKSSSVEAPGAAPAFPALLKTARFGYDGKGQVRVASPDEVADAHMQIGLVPAVLEERISFAREVSIIAVGDANGNVSSYDLAENVHENQILKTSTIPANVPENLMPKAHVMAKRIITALNYVGTLAVEFFHCPDHPDGPLLVNEIAPRVHNSGHWTLDACLCSQFENHIRAIAGWPLGSTTRHSDAVMTNLIGDEIQSWPDIANDPSSAYHDYAKGEARPGRKMGHTTRLSPIQTG